MIVGPTAVGKTAVALALAEYWPLEIVSADSRQVYRKLDIGTAKPSRKERARVPHHGIDVVAPGERYSAGHFARDAAHWVEEIQARGRLPVVVGGTGLYIRALAEGLFHEPPLEAVRRAAVGEWLGDLAASELTRWALRLDPGFRGGGRQRAMRAVEVALLTGRPLSHWQEAARAKGTVDPWYVVLSAPRPVLYQRILRRAGERVRRGRIEEVASVLADGTEIGSPGIDAIGIREAVDYLQGRIAREAVAAAIALNTRRYAKRQQTWFRHQLRDPVLALDATRPPEVLAAEIAEAWSRRLPPASRLPASGARLSTLDS